MKNSTLKRRRIFEKATEYEKQVAEFHGCEHKGGPGNPDFICPDLSKGEVKFRKKKMGKKELMMYAKKGNSIIESHAGFTDKAIDYKNRYRPNMVLCQQGNCDDSDSSILEVGAKTLLGIFIVKTLWNNFKK